MIKLGLVLNINISVFICLVIVDGVDFRKLIIFVRSLGGYII